MAKMNYSVNLKKTVIGRRVLMLLGGASCLSLAVGCISGYSLKAHRNAQEEQRYHISEYNADEFVLYGAFDDRCITEEISIDWYMGGLDFMPLDCDMPKEQQEFTYYLCKGYNIDFSLVMALIQHESSFVSDTVSYAKDYGYMQINEKNHEWLTESLGVTDYLDPYQNIRAGVFVLRKLFERYQDTNMVLMAYNMGKTGASRLWQQGIFETDYTQSIKIQQQQFNSQLEKESPSGRQTN